MARFKLGDKVYSPAGLDEVSLKDLVLFNTQAADMGLAERWSDVESASMEIATLSERDAERHPGKHLVIAVTIWISRRAAGEDLSFGDAIDFPMSSIEFIADPEDHKPGKRNGAKRSAPAKRTPKASAPAESEATPSA